jgi:hypothetical protein
MPETVEELRAEIERLKRERDELKSRGKTLASSDVSIRDVETFAMRIGPDEQILHINTAFARHIGVSRDDVVGQKANILRRSLNQEMLMAIARPEEGGSQVRMANDDRGKVFQINRRFNVSAPRLFSLSRSEIKINDGQQRQSLPGA